MEKEETKWNHHTATWKSSHKNWFYHRILFEVIGTKTVLVQIAARALLARTS